MYIIVAGPIVLSVLSHLVSFPVPHYWFVYHFLWPKITSAYNWCVAAMSAAMTFTPQHPSPLARTTSPFKNPRTAPSTPGNTEHVWDEYEKRAVENARRRDTMWSTSRRQTQQSRFSSATVLDIIKSYDPHSSPRVPSIKDSPRFDFGFPTQQRPQLPVTESTTVAICKTCKGSITSTLGICEACKKTIVLSSPAQATPPLTPTTQSFTLADPTQKGETSPANKDMRTSTSPKRRSRRISSAQLVDPPIRLSSLRPPPPSQSTPRLSAETSRPRNASLPGSFETLKRLPISRKPVPLYASVPATPTTPPSTAHSYHSATRTRPCSLANITTPPVTETSSYRSTRHNSATPSELSTLFPYLSSSTTTTSPPSVYRASYQLQNTMSAWEDSDSEDEEKVGLVKYWRGRKWRSSRGSLGSQSGQARRESTETGNEEERRSAEMPVGGRKRRGFVRVISCGCGVQ
ncbi:hypothetical protein BU23DRAFT_115166 [Bimuria novae-zelandiae CBS 107.79]|uniref:Uncharacterized protein n=1 Tax=Bimuria novae-zelandiae CBS 107.79 TaxID=1447943 RepID=A0A6A5VEE4_9PLEO|nr:hypothetical protein BU23DRAFT_115166 [Bimuria novae-zelandiae CBS 107.79]